MNFKIIEYESLLQNFALRFVFKQSFKLERRNNSGIEGRIGSIFAVHFLPSRRRDIGHDIRACLGPLEAILASNYTVKVTKGTVKGRGMFAGVDARSMQERVAKGTIRKERRRAERERGREREGRKREVHPAMRHNSWSDCELSQRPRELEVEEVHRTSLRDLWIISSLLFFLLPPSL